VDGFAQPENIEKTLKLAKVLMIIALLRLIRLTDFLKELNIWNNLTKALTVLSGPFFALSITLWYVYMIYASVGVVWFGGKVTMENYALLEALEPDIEGNDYWQYLNFNDYGMAMNTLFAIMALNDW
jgi:hypothetical protein